MDVRLARRSDLERVGEITAAAYTDFLKGPEDPYLDRLRDARARAREATLWVAADEREGPGSSVVVGSVTTCPPGSPWREIAEDGEGEMRMLAVDPDAQGRGVGRVLVGHVLARWRREGLGAAVLSSLPEMHAAHRLYESLGFTRVPERDWSPVAGTRLVAYRLDLTQERSGTGSARRRRPPA